MKPLFKISKGVTRVTFSIWRYVVKVPRLKNGHLLFLEGCLSNWKERNYCKMMKELEDYYNLVAPSLFCSWFGIIQVQKRCVVNYTELTESQLAFFEAVRGGESKPNNFGFINGRMVCLDYGS